MLTSASLVRENSLIERHRKEILEKCRRIAVVGPSSDPSSKSYLSIEKLVGLGLEVIPVLPGCLSYLGFRCYSRFSNVPGEVDIVQVYPGVGVDLVRVARESVQKGVRALWVEEGQADRASKEILAGGGVLLIGHGSLERESIP